ncbi:hypothetical protein Tco_0733923 [Tanacetum coccineum]
MRSEGDGGGFGGVVAVVPWSGSRGGGAAKMVARMAVGMAAMVGGDDDVVALPMLKMTSLSSSLDTCTPAWIF